MNQHVSAARNLPLLERLVTEDSGKESRNKTEKHKCLRIRRRFSRESPYHQFMRRRRSFFDVVQEWKFSRSTARSLARRRRLPRFFLLLSFLRIIGCNYIKVETYNTRHLALPPSFPSPNDRPAAGSGGSGRELLCGTSVICHAIPAAAEFHLTFPPYSKNRVGKRPADRASAPLVATRLGFELQLS